MTSLLVMQKDNRHPTTPIHPSIHPSLHPTINAINHLLTPGANGHFGLKAYVLPMQCRQLKAREGGI